MYCKHILNSQKFVPYGANITQFGVNSWYPWPDDLYIYEADTHLEIKYSSLNSRQKKKYLKKKSTREKIEKKDVGLISWMKQRALL